MTHADTYYPVVAGELEPARLDPETLSLAVDRLSSCHLGAVSLRLFWNVVEEDRGRVDASLISSLLRMLESHGLGLVVKAQTLGDDSWDGGGYPSWVIGLNVPLGLDLDESVSLEATWLKLVALHMLAPTRRSLNVVACSVSSDLGEEDHERLAKLLDAARDAGFINLLVTLPARGRWPKLSEEDVPALALRCGITATRLFLRLAYYYLRGLRKVPAISRLDVDGGDGKGLSLPLLIAVLIGLGSPLICIHPFITHVNLRGRVSSDSKVGMFHGLKAPLGVAGELRSVYHELRALLASLRTFCRYSEGVERRVLSLRAIVGGLLRVFLGRPLVYRLRGRRGDLLVLVNYGLKARRATLRAVAGEGLNLELPPRSYALIPLGLDVDGILRIDAVTAPIYGVYDVGGRLLIVLLSLTGHDERIYLSVPEGPRVTLSVPCSGKPRTITIGGARVQLLCLNVKGPLRVWEVDGVPIISDAYYVSGSLDEIMLEASRDSLTLLIPYGDQRPHYAFNQGVIEERVHPGEGFIEYKVKGLALPSHIPAVRLEKWYYTSDVTESLPLFDDSMWSTYDEASMIERLGYHRGFQWHRVRLPKELASRPLVYGVYGWSATMVNGHLIDEEVELKALDLARIKVVSVPRHLATGDLVLSILTFNTGNRSRPPLARSGVTTPVIAALGVVDPVEWRVSGSKSIADEPPHKGWLPPSWGRFARMRGHGMTWYKGVFDVPMELLRHGEEAWLFIERPGDAKIWFNGRLIANCTNRSSPIAIEVTDLVRPGPYNEVYIGLYRDEGVKGLGDVRLVFGASLGPIRVKRGLKGEYLKWHDLRGPPSGGWMEVRPPFIQRDAVGWYATFIRLRREEGVKSPLVLNLRGMRGLKIVYFNGRMMGVILPDEPTSEVIVPDSYVREGVNSVAVLIAKVGRSGLVKPPTLRPLYVHRIVRAYRKI